MNKQNVKGITLIALVITIIVLLILAGVSIAMLTGPNGLLTQANDAKRKTDESGAREKVEIAVASSWGENGFDADKFGTEVGRFKGEITPGEEKFPIKVTVDGQNFEVSEEGVVTQTGGNSPTTPQPGGDTATPGEKVTGSNKTYTNKGTAVIPVGFAIVPGLEDVSQGLVISDDANDTEADKSHIVANGNQFVWIPVTDPNSYKINLEYPKDYRCGNIIDDKDYLPTFKDGEKVPEGISEAEKEKNLVTSKGGFYISRYEAGDGLVTTERTGETDGTLVSKKDVYVYNWTHQVDVKEKSKTFINNEYVKSGLATGIQWDMVMAFVNGKQDGKGNDYIVTEVANDSSDSGSDRHLESLKKSGQNEADRVCNIYDLEGNCREWIAEKTSASYPYVGRGGDYHRGDSASNRSYFNYTAPNYYSFRFALYVI